MGLLQKAVETYHCHESYAGQYREGHTVLAPVSHLVTRAALEITLDRRGEFCGACQVDKSEPKILIPVSEGSAGRAGKVICAHPLCDQLGYLAPVISKKYEDYLEKLTKWNQSEYSHPMLQRILSYVQGGTILEDLEKCGLIKRTGDGAPEDEKLLVRWRVLGIQEEEACWKNQSLFRAFEDYYRSLGQQADKTVCMVTGENTRCAQQHPKGIIAFNGNAKLISANDTSGFTFRGRFGEDWQAATVGYEASQKAHNALRWLAAEQGAVFGGRTFLCWNPQGKQICTATGPFRRKDSVVTVPTEYHEVLRKTLDGYRSRLPEEAGVVIAAFDAATSGRLSLTYYNELKGSDFLQRLHDWDLQCCWPTAFHGIQSPELWKIVACAFGTQRTEKNVTRMVAEDRVLGQQIQRLVYCRVDKARIPWDIVRALTEKASEPMKYEKNIRRMILETACAVIRKDRQDRFTEEWDMVLEPDKKDISYQYGRLLAVLEKVELAARRKNEDTDRETNAIRQQTVFCQRPMYAAANLEKQLERAYFKKLDVGRRVYYKNLISEILSNINEFPEQQWNKPLRETYLMGYYLQRSAFYTGKDQNMEEE